MALLSREVLAEHGLVSFPKTSGSRGIHLNVRIHQRWSFEQVRRAALAVAREVERRAPGLATSAWWKEERKGVFLDYNQNAKDRTTAGAYSVRPTPDARVSTPLTWEEVPACNPADFTLVTVPARLLAVGDPAADIDRNPGSLDSLLELSARQAAGGQGRRALAPALSQDRRRADAGAALPPRRACPAPAERTRRLITVAKAADKADALAGLERWKARHPDAGGPPGPDRLPGRRHARPLDHLDPHPHQPRHHPRRRTPPHRTPRPRLRSLGEVAGEGALEAGVRVRHNPSRARCSTIRAYTGRAS